MMRKIVGAIIVIITLSMMSLLGSMVTGVSARGESAAVCREHRVKPGDTLWSIAKEYTDEKKDIRRYIYNIMEINGMNNPDIMPGQVIMIPSGR